MFTKGPPGTSSFIKLLIGAGKAFPAPRISPALSPTGVKPLDFCKQFNDRTKHLVPGIPIPTTITVKPDHTFTFVAGVPTTAYLIKRLGGKGSIKTISLKQVYEIARIKQSDPQLKNLTLEALCGMVISAARLMQIDVIP